MICPNCRSEGKEDAVECPSCGLIFSKWKERQQSAPPTEPARSAAAGAPGRGGLVGICVLTALGFGAWLQLKRPAASPSHGEGKQALEALRRLERESAYVPAPAAPAPGAPAEPAETCLMEGTVQDLLRVRPIAGAKVAFQAREGRDYEVSTDSEGRFSAQVAVLGERDRYQVSVLHPDYQTTWWGGGWTKYPRSRRLQLGRTIAFRSVEETSVPSCSASFPSAHHFALFPNGNDLSPEEREEIQSAEMARPASD